MKCLSVYYIRTPCKLHAEIDAHNISSSTAGEGGRRVEQRYKPGTS